MRQIFVCCRLRRIRIYVGDLVCQLSIWICFLTILMSVSSLRGVKGRCLAFRRYSCLLKLTKRNNYTICLPYFFGYHGKVGLFDCKRDDFGFDVQLEECVFFFVTPYFYFCLSYQNLRYISYNRIKNDKLSI